MKPSERKPTDRQEDKKIRGGGLHHRVTETQRLRHKKTEQDSKRATEQEALREERKESTGTRAGVKHKDGR